MNSISLKIIDANCCKIRIKKCKVAKTQTEETKKCNEKSKKRCNFKKTEKRGKASCVQWEAFIRGKLIEQKRQRSNNCKKEKQAKKKGTIQ